ncbi:MAG: histidine kinase dimerization/phospho-acceptor domain-containing protein, partial [Candidatus Saccharimonadales bacterium]
MLAKRSYPTHPSLDVPPTTVAEVQAESEAIFRSIGEGAIATDEFGRITRINPITLKILGFTEDELIGEWFPKVIQAVTVDNRPVNLIDRPITRAFLAGTPISANLFYLHKSGSKIPVALTCSPIIVEGKPVGAVEVFRDVTFEQEVDRMKSEFISLASHQLRTPLSAIKTYSHMLVDGYMGPLLPDQVKSLETIIGATNRMNELISTLLNIT